jgi:hypothetical protein
MERSLRKRAPLLIEDLLDLFFWQNIRERQAIRLQHGRQHETKSLWENFPSVIK